MPLANDSKHAGSRAETRFAGFLYIAAIALYALAISWGEPLARAPGHDMPWGSDELGPLGAIGELHRLLIAPDPDSTNPQYPLVAQVLQAVPVAAYLGWLRLTGGFASASAEYPYGLVDPVEALATMTLLARIPSLLLGAGVVVLALLTAGELWGARAGRFVGVATLLFYPLGYYARTSNVDAPALFLTAGGIYVFVRCLARGIDSRRLLAFGAWAALGTATKDASVAAFVACGAALAGLEFQARRRENGALLATVKLFLPALVAAVAIYVVASGLVFSVERFRAHIDWVSGSTAALVYPQTLAGQSSFLAEIVMHVLDSLGTPLLVLSVVGLTVSSRSHPRALLLLLPALATIALTILPVHFVNIRYVLLPCYLLLLFSGAAVSALSSKRSAFAATAANVLLAGVLGWSLVRAVDLTRQMRDDSRRSLAAWLTENARDGDLVAYWAAPQKLPRVARALCFVEADLRCAEAAWRGADAPAFALMIPQQHFEGAHEWTLSEEKFAAFRDGRLGYELVYRDDGVGWFARRPIPFVNPPLLVFARSRRAAALSPRIEEPRRRPLAIAEEWIGLTPGAPSGLVPNPARPVPCAS